VKCPTIKVRVSKKHFDLGKGVVVYTLLCNHIPLNSYIIDAHEYESYHIFDIRYRNTSDIMPDLLPVD